MNKWRFAKRNCTFLVKWAIPLRPRPNYLFLPFPFLFHPQIHILVIWHGIASTDPTHTLNVNPLKQIVCTSGQFVSFLSIRVEWFVSKSIKFCTSYYTRNNLSNFTIRIFYPRKLFKSVLIRYQELIPKNILMISTDSTSVRAWRHWCSY
jgi:hypothetical protein